MTSQIPFNWPIGFYLYFAGLAFGTSFLSQVFLKEKSKEFEFFLKLTLACVFLGLLGLLLDLERPSRFYTIITEFNPQSFISWGARILLVFASSCLLFLSFNKSHHSKFLAFLLLVSGLGLGLYPGFVLGQATARPLWDSGLLVFLFFITGLHSGGALIQLLRPGSLPFLKSRTFDLTFILIQVCTLGFFLSSSSVAMAAKQEFFSGRFSLIFWGLVIITGLMVPLLITIFRHENSRADKIRQLCYLQGAFFLRLLILFIGQDSQTFIGA